MDEIEIIFRVLKRGWWIILLVAALAVGGIFFLDSQTTPRYRTSARLLIAADPQSLQGRDLIYSYTSLDKASVVSTFVEIANSRRILNDAREALNLPAGGLIPYATSAVLLPSTNVIEIMVNGPDPVVVQAIANLISEMTISYVKETYQGYYLKTLDDAVLPALPYKPNLQQDTAVALIVGLVLGGLLAVLYDFMRPQSHILHYRRTVDRTSGALKRPYLERYLRDYSKSNHAARGVALALIQINRLHSGLSGSSTRRLLRYIVRFLHDELRGKDVIARWSPDSFAVLMPDITQAEARVVLDRLQEELSRPQEIPPNNELMILDPRIGMVASQDKRVLTAIIMEAETALEEAKYSDTKPVLFTPVP